VASGCAVIPTPGAFYDLAEPPPASKPGDVLRSEPMPGAPDGSSAFRVLYRSTGMAGEPTVVSGVVIVPAVSAPPGGRKVVAWAHPTTGVARDCAPSLLGEGFFSSVQGLSELLALGYVVTATDYPGLGTAGPHPYLVGLSEGQSLLDGVRAAHRLEQAQAGPLFAVWGHSQGGHAALFAGQLAATYAPELSLVGVAAAAPATDLGAMLEAALGTNFGNLLTAYSVWSWSRVYAAPIAGLVKPTRLPAMNRAASRCIRNQIEGLRAVGDVLALRDGFLAADPSRTEPWNLLMQRNRPGWEPRAWKPAPAPGPGEVEVTVKPPGGPTFVEVPAGAPLFIAQGTADFVVQPAITAHFVADLCRRGERVRYLEMKEVGHIEAGESAAGAAVTWMLARFEGAPAPSTCPLVGR
jgi:acetyl esterase/lipase